MSEPRTAPTPPPSPNALDFWPDQLDWRPVSDRLILLELLKLLIGLAVVLSVCAVLWLATRSDGLIIAVAVIGLIGAIRGFVTIRAVRSYGYAERERDLLVRRGRMIRKLSIVPYARMQFVDVTAGPLERLFNLANVQLHTAAAATDALIPGLEPTEARRLRDRLAQLGEDRGEGL